VQDISLFGWEWTGLEVAAISYIQYPFSGLICRPCECLRRAPIVVLSGHGAAHQHE